MILFNQALQVGNVLGRLLDKNAEIRLPKEYYPDLFVTENEAETGFIEKAEDKPKLSREMELHKARMDDFIFRHNMAMRMAKERGENNGRNDAGKAPGDYRGTDESLL